MSATAVPSSALQQRRHHLPKEDGAPLFYKLSAAELPDDLFHNSVDVHDWIGRTTDQERGTEETAAIVSKQVPWMASTTASTGFPPGALHVVQPIDKMVDIERCVGISLYMLGNVTPVVLPGFLVVWYLLQYPPVLTYTMLLLVLYHGTLFLLSAGLLIPYFMHKYQKKNKNKKDGRQSSSGLGRLFRGGLTTRDRTDHREGQYLLTERNTQKYCSMSYVWPASLHRPAMVEQQLLYCLIPHGLAPYGVVGYPYWSKLFNDKVCSWTCAPILFSLPFIGTYMQAIGYIPAKSSNILHALTKKNRNVGIILDGIDGMFYTTTKTKSQDPNSHTNEVGAILQRKGIVKIAIKANTPIVPCYGFGHTQLYDIYVDPFGILQWLSNTLNISLTPFFGRSGYWFLGPPKRDVPITVCLGDPIYPPTSTATPTRNSSRTSATGDDDNGDAAGNGSSSNITQEQIDDFHQQLLQGFTQVFETHKTGYYGSSSDDTDGTTRSGIVKKKLVFR